MVTVAVIDAAAELLNVESTNDGVRMESRCDWYWVLYRDLDTTCRLTNKVKESMPEVPDILGLIM